MQTDLMNSESVMTDSARMSLAPGEYGYAAPIIHNNMFFTDGINSGSDRVGKNGVDTESGLRGLGEHLSKYDTIRSVPSSSAPIIPTTTASLTPPRVRSKTLQRGLQSQQFGLRDVYPIRNLTDCVPIRSVVAEWGVNTREAARESC